jgi:DNA-binding MarR family transcriptional regulator
MSGMSTALDGERSRGYLMGDWTFFSNHGHVLVYLARDPRARLRDVALEVGITERAVQKIVRDLQEAGYLEISKQGRCNRYRINRRKALRHRLHSHCSIGKLLALLTQSKRAGERSVPASAGSEEKPAIVESVQALAEETPPAESADSPPDPAQGAPSDKERPRKKKKSPVDTRQQGSLF